MTDLSNWDFTEHFRGVEAAKLIIGIPPEANDGLVQLTGGTNGFTSKITPVLRRMERAFNEAGEHLYNAAMSREPVKEALDAFPLLPHGLHSETMLRARESKTEFGLAIFKEWQPTFDGGLGGAYFTRTELDRWLSAIGMQSAYQFVKIPVRYESIFNASDEVAEEFRQWLIMETWPYEAAMWLLAGVIPREIFEGMGFFTTRFKLLHNDNGEKDEKIHTIGNLKRLWLSNPSNPGRATPYVYLNWAAQKNIDIDWLESVQREGYLVADKTHSVIEEKPLRTSERKTLLTIIAAMAVKGLKLNIDQPGKAAIYIEGLTDELGAPVSKRAIEDHLKKIPDALETRMK